MFVLPKIWNKLFILLYTMCSNFEAHLTDLAFEYNVIYLRFTEVGVIESEESIKCLCYGFGIFLSCTWTPRIKCNIYNVDKEIKK